MIGRKRMHRKLQCERLEWRLVLSTLVDVENQFLAPPNLDGDYHSVIVAGDPNHPTEPDSPQMRIDPNTASSIYAGVGSLQIRANRGTFICTATLISPQHALTAGHCLDLNNDGKSNKKDGIRSVTLNLNLDSDTPSDQVDVQLLASSWVLHPDFTGFAHPSINDDVAVVTLNSSAPSGVPAYSYDGTLVNQEELNLVGYGRSGNGVSGYTTSASFTVKRRGENIADTIYGQDDVGRPSADEAFRFDFDAPNGSNGPTGGPSLGNRSETTLGGGDSGGPSFVLKSGLNPSLASSYAIAGVNTFVQSGTASYPKFGSFGGGIIVAAYRSWIDSVLAGSTGSSSGATSSSGHSAFSTSRFESILDDAQFDFLLPGDVLEIPSAHAAPLLHNSEGQPSGATDAELPANTDVRGSETESRQDVYFGALTMKTAAQSAGPEKTVKAVADAVDELLQEWPFELLPSDFQDRRRF